MEEDYQIWAERNSQQFRHKYLGAESHGKASRSC
jgi:hypothetical protein